MNELLKTKLFDLLSNTSQATNQEMKNAYGHFMEQIKTTVSRFGNSYCEIFRMLNITRIELVSLRSILQYEQGEKCN